MKEIDIDELRKIQIKILDNIDSFCKKNKINYWIDCGTLLGAVRHSGYIPWDDDIDIGMLREDYEKFLKLYNKDNTRYKLQALELQNDYYFPFGKVVDTKTILYEPDERVEILEALRVVDEVKVYETLCPEYLETVDFDILALEEDHRGGRFDVAENWCKEHGKKVVRLKRTPGICSSNIKEELKKK